MRWSLKIVLQEGVQEEAAFPATCKSHKRRKPGKWRAWQSLLACMGLQCCLKPVSQYSAHTSSWFGLRSWHLSQHIVHRHWDQWNYQKVFSKISQMTASYCLFSVFSTHILAFKRFPRSPSLSCSNSMYVYAHHTWHFPAPLVNQSGIWFALLWCFNI